MTEELLKWLLVFVRVGAVLAVLPMFSAQNFPVQLRLGLGALMAFLLAPLLPATTVDGLTQWGVVRLVFLEAAAGLLLGFVCRMVFYALEMAGNLVATEMGLMLSSTYNPLTSTATPAPGIILYWMALMLWLGLDLHHGMLVGLQRSYALVPVGGLRPSEALLADVITRSGGLMVLGLQIAAPVMAVSFVITIVFSVLGRAVPQMNVFSESFPVRTLAGLAVFGLTCTFMAQHIGNYLRRLPEDMLRVAQLMGAG